MLEGPNHIWMQPWVGNNYPVRRLLIVGESAYDDPANNYCVNPRTNIDIIGEEVEGTLASSHKSQKQVAKIVCGTAKPNYSAFWESVAFYNFVQTALSSRESRQQIVAALPRSKSAFAELVGLVSAPVLKPRPTHIVAVGTSVTWEEMPPCVYTAQTWAYALQGYKYPDGTVGLATVIDHPGMRRRYPFEKMAERVRHFLRLKPDECSVRELLSSESASLFQ
jgi:hypothetical protein